MLATKVLRAGDGYQYLSRQVASGDVELARDQRLADYYAASGTSPGRWHGHGLRGLVGNIEPGDVVTIEAMSRVFRDGCDPTSGEPLGVPFSERKGGGSTVAGYDLVFTAPKSASVLWALGDEPTRTAVVAAHRAALAQAIDFVERKAVRTRIGPSVGSSPSPPTQVAGRNVDGGRSRCMAADARGAPRCGDDRVVTRQSSDAAAQQSGAIPSIDRNGIACISDSELDELVTERSRQGRKGQP